MYDDGTTEYKSSPQMSKRIVHSHSQPATPTTYRNHPHRDGLEVGLRTILSLPIIITISIAALDAADRGLLASSFPLLEKQFGMDVSTMGYFSLVSNLSYSFSMPFWGWLIHRHSIAQSPLFLSSACMAWGVSTLVLGMAGSNVMVQLVMRSMNGAAIAGIMPLSQTMLCEWVPHHNMLGRTFDLMGLAERISHTIASASIIWFDDWQKPFVVVGMLSIIASLCTNRYLVLAMRSTPTRHLLDGIIEEGKNINHHKKMTLRKIIRRISRLPAFLCLVGQGVFGGIPWDMMSFVLLLLQWRGFTKEQIVSLQFSKGLSGMCGSYMGGYLGDTFSYHPRGRPYVVICGKLIGMVSLGMFLHAKSYHQAFLWNNLLYLTATWTPAAAIRPICAELAMDSSERAQIVAMWLLIEKCSAAIFGAPLVGYLTNSMVGHDDNDHNTKTNDEASPEKADVLAFNLLMLSILFWTIACCFWILMAYVTDPTTQQKENITKKKNSMYECENTV